jgi:hypothetical protein
LVIGCGVLAVVVEINFQRSTIKRS